MDRQLGDVVSTHPTENGRRLRTAVGLLLLGVLGTGVGVPLCTAYLSADSAPSFAPGGILGIGLASLVGGTVLALGARRDKGEVFVRHTRGLVHRRGGIERALLWTEVTSVSTTRPGRGTVAKLVGRDVACAISSPQGDMHFTGWTRGAAGLAAEIEGMVDRGGGKSRWEA
ncbi:hypothetical protein [Kitasatospora phosalacinea]|uniref:PH domain-containing protein n=1 Tax=Kitasatospora phosalacinea TaxID=2065 RepID=A0ABW6GF73_9ACTN